MRPLLFLVLSILTASCPAAAGEAVSFPRHAPGDVYSLYLEKVTETEATAARTGVDPFRERAEIAYRADVEVLAVDDQGRPIRERHDRVRVQAGRGEESGSLFGEGVSFEVERSAPGEVRLWRAGRRVSAGIEAVVAPLLARELGASAEALEPGRPVAPGESWEISRSAARRLLRERDVRAVRFDGAPTATLATHESDPGRVVLHYRIPVSRCEPETLPDNTRVTRSQAVVEARVDLAAGAGDEGSLATATHTADFRYELSGSVAAGGVAASRGFRLERSERWVQRIHAIDVVAHRRPTSDAAPAALAP